MVNIRDLQWQKFPGKEWRRIGIHKVMNDDLTMCWKTSPNFPSKTKTNHISILLIDYIWVILMKYHHLTQRTDTRDHENAPCNNEKYYVRK